MSGLAAAGLSASEEGETFDLSAHLGPGNVQASKSRNLDSRTRRGQCTCKVLLGIIGKRSMSEEN